MHKYQWGLTGRGERDFNSENSMAIYSQAAGQRGWVGWVENYSEETSGAGGGDFWLK